MRKTLLLLTTIIVAVSFGCSMGDTGTQSPNSTATIQNRSTATSISATREPFSSPTSTSTSSPNAAQTSETPTLEISPTPNATMGQLPWESMPVVPTGVSQTTLEIYLRGLSLGNNPQAFSKVGDCGSTPAWFLGDFDNDPKYYSLGDNEDLEAVIQEFQGSFDRTSLAAKSGFNASSILTPLWANRDQCQPDETPLACEYRVHRPSFAFIMLGTNDIWHIDRFEPQMRKIIEYSIDNGVVPILSTKADNGEGDGSINATIVRLAIEYQIPLWNYWSAIQPLPQNGLQEDGAHISWGPNRFDDPKVMQKGWPVRNLTALQTLDAVWREVTK